MVRAALDDAGLELARRRRGLSSRVVGGLRRVPRYRSQVHGFDQHRRIELRGPCRARSGGDRRGRVRRGRRRLRRDTAKRSQSWHPPAPAPWCGRRGPEDRVGDALRAPHADGPVRARCLAAHGRVRDDVRTARADRGEHPRVGLPQPASAVSGADHHRGRPRVAHGVEPAAPSRLLSRHRRRRRVRARHRASEPPRSPSRPCTCWARPPATTI